MRPNNRVQTSASAHLFLSYTFYQQKRGCVRNSLTPSNRPRVMTTISLENDSLEGILCGLKKFLVR